MSNNTVIDSKNPVLEKHKKYGTMYQPNDIYWGFGIENEVYLQFEEQKEITMAFFLENHKRERYSVNYYDNYKQNDNFLKYAFQKYWDSAEKTESGFLNIPLMMNSHSFINTDVKNQSIKRYSKDGGLNPLFSGTTFFDDILSEQGYFTETSNVEWLFDGDSIEFATIHFYNARIYDVLNELNSFKQRFIENINNYIDEKDIQLFKNNGKISIMTRNQPFAIYMTNLQNIGIFNNGTLHFNITLPTKLDGESKIECFDKFIEDHRKAVKIIQWIEPLFIAVYNSPDPFSLVGDEDERITFTGASQRCAISRYIGVGTYNSDLMEKGKILTRKIEEMDYLPDYFWYKRYHKTSAYNELKEIGFDINFNKHYSHGLEIRFFDHIPDESLLEEACEMICLLMDEVLFDSIEENRFSENPIKNKLWNDIVVKCIQKGRLSELDEPEVEVYEDLFKTVLLNKDKSSSNIKDLYYKILNKLRQKFSVYDSEKELVYYMGEFTKKSIRSRTMSKEEAIQKGYISKIKPTHKDKNNDDNNNKRTNVIDNEGTSVLDNPERISLENIELDDSSDNMKKKISQQVDELWEKRKKNASGLCGKTGCCVVS